jgi:amidophosphoribosyltransferase
MAHCWCIKYREGFIKNRYIGRTFIMPGQGERKSVRQKLNAIEQEFRDKNVMLVDDSIVRGTTSRQIILMAREAGARKVYFASAAPPVRHPNVYGIDMPAANELIAHGRDEDAVCAAIGADRLIYQDLDDLVAAVQRGNRSIQQLRLLGVYRRVRDRIGAGYLDHLASLRADGVESRPRWAARSWIWPTRSSAGGARPGMKQAGSASATGPVTNVRRTPHRRNGSGRVIMAPVGAAHANRTACVFE